MDTNDYLRVITEEIHSTVVATLDADGHPVTRVIDMMLSDDHGIYFLTATGKEFYRQLIEQEYLSLSGMSLQRRSYWTNKIADVFNKFLLT